MSRTKELSELREMGAERMEEELKQARKELARIKTELRARELRQAAESGAAGRLRGPREERRKKTARRLRGAAVAKAKG